jgi:hypothetical protein
MSRPCCSGRTVILQRRIKWMEKYHNGVNSNNLNTLIQELAELLKQDVKADKLRNLLLYSCRIAGWKFVCSRCYDKIYNNNRLL